MILDTLAQIITPLAPMMAQRKRLRMFAASRAFRVDAALGLPAPPRASYWLSTAIVTQAISASNNPTRIAMRCRALRASALSCGMAMLGTLFVNLANTFRSDLHRAASRRVRHTILASVLGLFTSGRVCCVPRSF